MANQSRAHNATSGPYSVNHWGSHPDKGNDDCWTGDDFATFELALADYNVDPDCYTAYVELDGPEVYMVRANPNYSPKQCRIDSGAERSEFAMQQGMAFGCQGYNEAMGWD